MPFFRRPYDLAQATLRDATAADVTAVSRLLRDGPHRFLSPPTTDLPALLGSAPAIVLGNSKEIAGVAVAGWSIDDVTWLRALGLTDGLEPAAGIDVLLPALIARLRARGISRLFYAGDITADQWIQPEFVRRGWRRETDVVVYEKTNLDIPSRGDERVRVRRAQPVDLRAVLALDRISFVPQWVKDEGLLGAALIEQQFFMIAESSGVPVGYAFATSHFNGRLVHLVRIAVDPARRGQGIGVRLMAEVVNFARRSAAETLTLNTQSENHTAQRLYEWFGFRRTGESQTVLRLNL